MEVSFCLEVCDCRGDDDDEGGDDDDDDNAAILRLMMTRAHPNGETRVVCRCVFAVMMTEVMMMAMVMI